MRVIFPNLEKDGLRALFERTSFLLNPKRGKATNLIQKLIFLSMVPCFFAHYVSMYYAGLDKSLKETASFAVMAFIINFQQMAILCNQNNLRKLLDSMDGFEKRRSPKEKEFFVMECKRSWKITEVYWKVMLYYWFVEIIIPIVLDVTAGWINPEVPSLRMPLLMKGFIDMVGPRSLYGLLISAFGAHYSILLMFCNVVIEMSLVLIIAAVRSEMKILCLKLERLKRLPDPKMYASRTSLYDVVTHHQCIVKVLDQISNVYALPMAVQNIVITICFCVALYQTTTVKDSESLRSAAAGLFILVFLLCLIFVLCREGESLETQVDMDILEKIIVWSIRHRISFSFTFSSICRQNNEIQRCLYDLSWYEATPGFRKNLNLMIRQAQKPYVISYHDMFHLNMATFIEIINTSYSYFMVLRTRVN